MNRSDDSLRIRGFQTAHWNLFGGAPVHVQACRCFVKLTSACSSVSLLSKSPEHALGCSMILNTDSEVSLGANLFITQAIMFK